MSQSKTDLARIQSVLESMYEIESYVTRMREAAAKILTVHNS